MTRYVEFVTGNVRSVGISHGMTGRQVPIRQGNMRAGWVGQARLGTGCYGRFWRVMSPGLAITAVMSGLGESR